MYRATLWTALFALLATPSLIRAQIPLDEFPRVANELVAGDQLRPDVAADGGGNFLEVWDSPDDFLANRSIQGRVFDGEGDALTGEFQIAAGDYYVEGLEPRTAWMGDGDAPDSQRFVVVWSSRDDFSASDTVEARIIDFDGVQTLLGQFPVSADLALPFAPAVAADPTTGNFAVVWKEVDDSIEAIRGAWYDRDGTDALDLFDVEVGGFPLGLPEVSVPGDGSGEFVVTYPARPGSSDLIQAKRFRADGAGTVSEVSTFQVNVGSGPYLSASAPAAHNGTGSTLVVWHVCQSLDAAENPTDCGVFGRINPEDPSSPEMQINSAIAFDQTSPSVTADTAGDFITFWHDQVLEDDILFDATSQQRLRPLAVPQLGPLYLDSQYRRMTIAAGPPRVAALPEQRYVGTWAEGAAGDPDNLVIAYQRFAPSLTPKCTPDQITLCLNGDRFRITARWTTAGGGSGSGRPAQMTADSGYFWFFDPANVELVVKVLQACGSEAPCFWIFAGGMTDVGVELVVTDTMTGRTATYSNPVNRPFEPVSDTTGFPFQPADAGSAPAWQHAPRVSHTSLGGSVKSSCGGTADALCLLRDRFHVELEWATARDEHGTGRGVRLSSDAGFFWFFNLANVEVLFKVLDGCAWNGHYWVFAAGLTDVEVNARVVDAQTGRERLYHNPLGSSFRPVLDTSAFACAPEDG